MLPPIVSDPSIHRFKFWAHGCVQDGMRHEQELYRLTAAFPSGQCHYAYCLAIDLIGHGRQVVLSKSDAEYAVWVALRLPAALSSMPECSTAEPGKSSGS